ncbi:hypothetical protein RU97_GL000297 [Enterococcus canis]|uniref:YigZ family protein n=1 Tax=Enterococcus canis TaxID=214095 RepID=A0A1L8RK27_9ENTE|nr:YigZ family protein [Enterococcus canis]OJG20064.1 hypothetical protein RU97_GL000297 [Enterococcus canis]
MLPTYYTLAENGQHEIEIKKSRFICTLRRVESEDAAREFIQEIKKEHWKATHNCSAYLLGERSEIQRSSDDGEPSGTAGIPMLEVLKKNELINVAAVVTRYFGGTKLGAGGLIRAYSHAVSEALTAIGIVQGQLQQELLITISYPLLGKLQNFLELQELTIADTVFTEQVVVTVMVTESQLTTYQEMITDLLSGQVTFTEGATRYFEQRI